MNEENQSKSEAKKGTTPNHIALYQKIAAHSDEIYDVLLELLQSRNDNIRLGAAKTLLNKILPDKKIVEVTGENGEPIKLTIVTGNGFVPPGNFTFTTSTGSITQQSSAVQSDSMAPEGKKDDNSGNGASQASSPT